MEGSVNTMNDLAQYDKMIWLLPWLWFHPQHQQNSEREAGVSLNAARDGRGKALRTCDMFEPVQRVLRVPPCLQVLLTMI